MAVLGQHKNLIGGHAKGKRSGGKSLAIGEVINSRTSRMTNTKAVK